ncbi:MAG: OsmC family protein [Anaerolineales bacterium]|nr:OsmC family protein [Anaerolineales bacterium]
METKVTWKQGLSFDGQAESGFIVPLGADPAVGGANDGFRPLELLAISLAGCTAMDVVSILQKKRQAVTAFEVHLAVDRAAEHPKVFTRAVITYAVTGQGIDEAALLRAIELSSVRYCPAQAMLGKAFPMELRYQIYADQDDGSRQLLKEKIYQPAQA